MEDVRVLMIDSEETWRGGEGQLYLLMQGLSEYGVQTTLAAPEASAIAGRARELGVPCLPLSISGGLDLAAAWRLRRYLRAHPFDIVHCHSSHAHSVAFPSVASMSHGRPRLVVSRRVDFAVAKSGLSRLKYRHADVFVAISRGVRDVLIRCGVAAERIELVRSGIDLNKFAGVKDNRYLLKEFGLTAKTPVVGNIAALAPHKSQVDFVRAARLVKRDIPDARFFIVGEGDSRPSLESLIRELEMTDDVILTGFRQDVLEILSLLDCFVLSSYLEGLCTSIMDAQACGVSVVATNTGGVPDLVDDGVTGILVPPRDPEQLAQAIVRMLREPGLRENCVRAAKEKSKSYDYRNMVAGTVAVYNGLLGQRGVRVN
jgi:glycosyltransferase involved in cell wall biosynthesis